LLFLSLSLILIIVYCDLCAILDMYREWKKTEFTKEYYIYEFGNNKIESLTKK
jgi:hypothetical protein